MDVKVELLDRTKRRSMSVFSFTAVSLLALSAVRFLPRLNDALSGKPEYVRILTETFARQLASQTQMQFPVIVEQDEHGMCPPVGAASIPDEEVRGTIYLLTYSEKQHLTCISTYIVPTDESRFSVLRSFTPAEGKVFGPPLLGMLKGITENRIHHIYSTEYLKRLHWRYTPHFPLSANEAAALKSQSYYSGAAQLPGGSASIEFDYGELRAEVAQRHRKVDIALTWLCVGVVALLLFLLRKLWLLYRRSAQYFRLYELKLTPGVFVKKNIATELNAARRQYFERQHQAQVRLRADEKLRALTTSWQEGLRSALPNLIDESLRRRIQECLDHQHSDCEEVKSLWVEVQEKTGTKTPADKLNLLIESTKPYCTEEEFATGRAEAFAILNRSGFRAARTFAITMHDQFRLRSREMEELETRSSTIRQQAEGVLSRPL